MQLLSRISEDRTVGFLRAKKKSGSTQRGLTNVTFYFVVPTDGANCCFSYSQSPQIVEA